MTFANSSCNKLTEAGVLLIAGAKEWWEHVTSCKGASGPPRHLMADIILLFKPARDLFTPFPNPLGICRGSTMLIRHYHLTVKGTTKLFRG